MTCWTDNRSDVAVPYLENCQSLVWPVYFNNTLQVSPHDDILQSIFDFEPSHGSYKLNRTGQN